MVEYIKIFTFLCFVEYIFTMFTYVQYFTESTDKCK